jgi:hypothetical protein
MAFEQCKSAQMHVAPIPDHRLPVLFGKRIGLQQQFHQQGAGS